MFKIFVKLRETKWLVIIFCLFFMSLIEHLIVDNFIVSVWQLDLVQDFERRGKSIRFEK